MRKQLSWAGLLIGCIGCVIITASSVYTALKMGALPWPTIFTSITALVLLRALGRTSLNEVNITQVIMSAGSMVAGGLAFTIPGIWMLGGQVSLVETLGVALAGTLLGLVATALIRRRFVDESDLEYPIGIAAAETLKASRDGGKTRVRLFGSMGLAGLWCVARDVLGVIPTMLLQLPIPGVSFGIYNSPMLLSVGFLLGGAPAIFWIVGAVLGNLGIPVVSSALGVFDTATAQGVVSSLGMGLMMGSGVGVVVRDILPQAVSLFRSNKAGEGMSAGSSAAGSSAAGEVPASSRLLSKFDAGALGLIAAAAALVICLVLGIPVLATLVILVLAFVTAIMSAQSVGSTGIDPMEIFGLIVLLVVAAVSPGIPQVKLFFVAGVVAVACGLAGDVMSDFKTGAIIGTSPRAMWGGQAVGALLGTVVATVVMSALVSAYGIDAFGPGKEFVSAQASVVATMISGIPNMPAFIGGLVAGIVLHCLRVPAMMIGLGVYLPFYMSLSAALGAAIHAIYARVTAGKADADEAGTLVASGILGGESIVGVVIALMSVISGLGV